MYKCLRFIPTLVYCQEFLTVISVNWDREKRGREIGEGLHYIKWHYLETLTLSWLGLIFNFFSCHSFCPSWHILMFNAFQNSCYVFFALKCCATPLKKMDGNMKYDPILIYWILFMNILMFRYFWWFFFFWLAGNTTLFWQQFKTWWGLIHVLLGHPE